MASESRLKRFVPAQQDEMIDALEGRLPEIRPGDMALIAQKLDFLGINSYSRSGI